MKEWFECERLYCDGKTNIYTKTFQLEDLYNSLKKDGIEFRCPKCRKKMAYCQESS